ncbi:MAG: D-alanyl-lipoteichoic acid biosynthesis protein DltB [Chthoniobacterales bacterium]
MIPYASYFYFGIAALVSAIPLLWMNLWRGSMRFWILTVSAVMLVIQYGGAMPAADSHISELGWLAIYGGLECFVAVLFLQSRKRSDSRWIFATSIALAVGPLVLSRIFGHLNHPLGFAGVSYAVFRSIDLLVGIQDGKVRSLGLGEFFAYLFFFPTVSSGPIDRFARFQKDYAAVRTREQFFADLDVAVHQIFTGFLYKYIVAHYLNKLVLGALLDHAGVWRPVVYFYGYALYLFFDFAGYSAFAVGVSYLLGIRTPVNFNKPFLAKNIRDFWNRWHMSLSAWFRDHIYMRFVMGMMKWGRIKNAQTISALGLLLSFGLMGVWHGTKWHYIVYGFYQAGLMIGYEQWTAYKKRRKWTRTRRWTDALSVVLTFHCVCLGFLIFAGGVPVQPVAVHHPAAGSSRSNR